MRYFWALLAYVTAIVVAAASCGGTGKGNGFTNTGAGNTGGAGTGNGGNGSTGGGGSTGVGITIPDSGPPPGDGGCPAYKGDCAAQGLNCGMATDGCGNVINCGDCTDPTEACGVGGTANVCAKVPCAAGTCPSLGYNCGMAGDGCGGTLDCGTCTGTAVCGGGGANVCGAGTCTPKTCQQQGLNCGMQGDTCGGSAGNCGTCPAGQICGLNQNGVCGTPTCTPKTCAQQGFNCGQATDGCGMVINCGTCGVGQFCGGGGANVCGGSVMCTGLCTQQVMCSGSATTSITGTVYAPNGTDPLPNTLVYVPNGGAAPTYGVQPFVDGVNTPHCNCGSDVTGNPLVSAVTDYKGQFTITNMPVGANIPLVIQNGRWRRQFTIPNVAMCVNTALPTTGASQLRMPRTKAEGNIPLMGFVTGDVDALECVLRKIGIADSEFTNPSGTGRVRFYLGDNFAYGAQINASTPDESTLWGNQATLNGYDMVYFACKGFEYDRTAAAQNRLIAYANAGGRVFTTHYSYVWLFNDAPFSTTATWAVDQFPFFSSDPETGFIDTTFPKGLLLAQWLQYIGASTVQGQMTVATLRDDFTGVNPATSQLWIYLNDPNYPPKKPMHYTFTTPVGAPPASQCGKVLYDDFHVEDAITGGVTFPQECTSAAMTPQEKMLEFMIFDLGSCVTPPVCVPKTCAQQSTMCGAVGDGCGNILMCGTCPANQACVAGKCQGCTPKTCAQEGFMCGQQGDGCGNIINCGTCPSGTCGGGGTPGVCGNGTCTPKTCAQQNLMCGSAGDGCGNVINCGTCPAGQICGGGGTPGVCYTPPCQPKTCAQLGYNCGNASDGCGKIINCGSCSGTQTCGGGGTPNVCGGGAG